MSIHCHQPKPVQARDWRQAMRRGLFCRCPNCGEGRLFRAFLKPVALGWLLSGRYRTTRDPSLTGLATPARISLLTIFFGLACAGLLWLLSVVMA